MPLFVINVLCILAGLIPVSVLTWKCSIERYTLVSCIPWIAATAITNMIFLSDPLIPPQDPPPEVYTQYINKAMLSDKLYRMNLVLHGISILWLLYRVAMMRRHNPEA